MNAQHPVQTIRARRALNEYVANSRSAHHSAAIHPFPEPTQPEACQMCAELDDTDSPLPAMLFNALLGLIAWAVFGWAVVTIFDAIRSAA
jgi:hypothetical protein